jgi:hypothetical protein
MKEISARGQRLFDCDAVRIPSVDLRERAQLDLLQQFSSYYEELPFSEKFNGSTRYYYENGGWFGQHDAIILYCALRHFKPRRIIEIGSGFSSAVMLDTSELFLNNQVAFTFVEPYADRLMQIMRPEDKRAYRIIKEPVQQVPVEVFQELTESDILFIDSSHVAKIGSDVCHNLFNILPRLHAGVIVHFHDIFWPFEYPKQWIMEGISWNEAYFLRAFLQNNATFEILLFSSFLECFHRRALKSAMPLLLKSNGSSFWIRKAAR